MIKRQKKWILILGISVLVLGIAYFAVLLPILKKMNADDTTPVELLDGEVLGSNNRILLFERVEKAYIQSIEVHNQKGSWKLYRGANDEFCLEEYEKATISLDALSSLVVNAGYTLSMSRVTMDCRDFSEYGLDEASNPAWYVLTTTAGISYKVWIGDLTPTGAGYYCRFDGRNAVYTLDSDIAGTLLAPVEAMAYPLLSYPVGTQDFYLTRDFVITHGGETFVHITYAGDKDNKTGKVTRLYRMLAPADYVPNTENYGKILSTLSEYTGTETLLLGKSDQKLTEEQLAPYGLDHPAYELKYTYNDVESYVCFSELQEGGYYYAYSLLWNLVAKVDAETSSFLQWDLIQYVSDSIYLIYTIDDVASITLISPTAQDTFKLVGEGTTLEVTPASTGKVFDSYYLYNFRQFFKTMLIIYMQDYADRQTTDPEDLLLTLKIQMDDGTEYEYKFYEYSTRRCYYTINGKGEFYVLRDAVEKLVSDYSRLMAGEDVDSWSKN